MKHQGHFRVLSANILGRKIEGDSACRVDTAISYISYKSYQKFSQRLLKLQKAQ